MVINVHAGHNPDGKIACGAVGFIRESTEARRVKNAVINMLWQMGHTVYDCTCETGTSQSSVLTKIVSLCNVHEADLDVSIHFNSGARDSAGNGKTTGTEVYVYNTSSRAKAYAESVCAAIAALGFKNRGVKYSTGLYVLKNTKAPAMLIECCFVDDKDDVQLYDCHKMAEAIVYGITGKKIFPLEGFSNPEAAVPGADSVNSSVAKKLGRVQVGAYSVPANAEAMKKKLVDAGFTDAIIVWS